MITECTLNKLKEKLEKLAARQCWCDDPDFSADDYGGGNFDDAYSGGRADGEAGLAQEILDVLNSN